MSHFVRILGIEFLNKRMLFFKFIISYALLWLPIVIEAHALFVKNRASRLNNFKLCIAGMHVRMSRAQKNGRQGKYWPNETTKREPSWLVFWQHSVRFTVRTLAILRFHSDHILPLMSKTKVHTIHKLQQNYNVMHFNLHNFR
jgi:hypothetical protein